MKYSPYSFSKIECFQSCPYKFNLKYIQKIKIAPPDPRHFEKGNFYHWMLEKYPCDPSDFKWKYADEHKQKLFISNIDDFIKEPKVQSLLKKKLGTEVEFKYDNELDPTDGSKWKSGLYGYIDYVGMLDKETYLIADWKSKDHGERFPTKESQLEMYATWIFDVRPKVNKVFCFFYYVEDKTFNMFEYTREENHLTLKTNIINKIKNIECTKEFSKNVAKTCDRCDYFKICKPFNVKVKK